MRKHRSFDEREQKSLRHNSWAAVAGAAISVGGALLSPKAKAPAQASPQGINLQDQQNAAIQGNIANLGNIEGLVGESNKFQQQQAIDMINQAIPGYSGLQSKLTSTASGLLTDPYSLPKDVQDNLSRLAAERGISAGTRGQFNDFSLLRDFGINSLQYGAQRIGQAQSLSQTIGSLAPKVNPLSPMSFYVTPQQTADIAAGNRSAQQASNNAQAAAGNFNNANEWSNITKSLGFLNSSGALNSMFGGSGTNAVPQNVASWGPITPEG